MSIRTAVVLCLVLCSLSLANAATQVFALEFWLESGLSDEEIRGAFYLIQTGWPVLLLSALLMNQRRTS